MDMTSEAVQAVIDELFQLLSEKFASKPLVHMLVQVLKAVADGLVNQISENVSRKGVM
jgi:hypothetical protein